MKNTGILCILVFLGGHLLLGQVVTTQPTLPGASEALVITFDASKGNRGLQGLPAGAKVYAHLGLITPSGGAANWQYVVGNWGTADSRTEMTRVGTSDVYKLTLSPNVLEWFEKNNNDKKIIPPGTRISQIACVFRNVDGTRQGKTDTGGDIFIQVAALDGNFWVSMEKPSSDRVVEKNAVLNILAVASEEATFKLFDNGRLLNTVVNDSLEYPLTVESDSGTVIVEAMAQGKMARDSFRYFLKGAIDVPAFATGGLERLDEHSVRLKLYAPGKNSVHVIGDFNEWKVDNAYKMSLQPDNATWAITLTGLETHTEYAYQYLVDGIKVADPLSEKVLDAAHDPFISTSIYPNLKKFPDKTNGIVSSFTIAKEPFVWLHDQYERPSTSDLVVYELLLRDFLQEHNYQSLLDTLGYLKRLGINAIELMPVSEFEANVSWGYNVSFHMALDKYYGTAKAFKKLVDACHANEMAVILDVVYNHAFSQSPLCRLYWNDAAFEPTADNPWVNVTAKHPFNVGYDLNHESKATRDYVKQTLTYWLEEFHVDGFRFDLAKGFTQKISNDDGQFRVYDPSRIAVLSEYANTIWAENPEAYVILELFADNEEETELTNKGMLVWSDGNYQYNEATMGYQGDFTTFSYLHRGFSAPHLLNYMESHDTERLMYKNKTYGNAAGAYDVKNINTGLRRIEAAAVMFFSIPGPKMIWQFGELGYDHSIYTCANGTVMLNNDGCKLEVKPAGFPLAGIAERQRIFHVFREMIGLKQKYDVFKSEQFQINTAPKAKFVKLQHPDLNVIALANFDVVENSVSPGFYHSGVWYDYFSGDSISVTLLDQALRLAAGEYRLYTDKFVGKARLENLPVATRSQEATGWEMAVYPNPTTNQSLVTIKSATTETIVVNLYNTSGQLLMRLHEGVLQAGQELSLHLALDTMAASGTYYIGAQSSTGFKWLPLIVQK